MTRPPLFAELCAGLASMSLMLQHGKHCKPPVSRMGNKHGYGLAILRVMGLRPGQRAEQYLWCEPDPGCRALLTAYTDPALMREAADIIRGWKDEDPRALWERLRADGPIRDFGAREVGRWVQRSAWSYEQGNVNTGFCGPGERRQDTRAVAVAVDAVAQASELARYLQVTASNRLVNTDSTTMRNSGKGGTTFGGDELATGAERVADAASEVARMTYLTSTSHGTEPRAEWTSGFVHPEDGGRYGASRKAQARKLAAVPAGLPAHIATDAREHLPTEPLPPGCVAYIDPPYIGTTGYGNDLTRAEVVRMAEAWADAGAAVYISEAEPLSELAGWHQVEITSTRIGQKRTFSKQKREWLTMNRKPAWVPAVQQGLFG